MGKKLTIVDIARLAGVSKSTVSRVLTNAPRVNPETRKKIERVMEQSGYVPSKSAQSMRRQNPKLIGIILSRLDSASENRAVSSMLQVLYAHGYDAVIMESQFSDHKVQEHLSVLEKRQVDGVIVFGFTGLNTQRLMVWHHRAVVIAMDVAEVSSINYDNDGIIRQALNYLADKQLRHISYIGVDPSDKTTGYQRLNAYLSWCHQAGIFPCYQTGKLAHDSAYRLVDSILSADTQAIVCASDTLAMGVVKRLQERQRHDVLVTGVGGNTLLSFLFPNVYSIDPGYREAGEQAGELLIEQLATLSYGVHLTQPPLTMVSQTALST